MKHKSPEVRGGRGLRLTAMTAAYCEPVEEPVLVATISPAVPAVGEGKFAAAPCGILI